jgi:hypothetical protein
VTIAVRTGLRTLSGRVSTSPRFDPGDTMVMVDRHDGRDMEARLSQPQMPDPAPLIAMPADPAGPPEPARPREPPQIEDPAFWSEAVLPA